VAHAGQGAQHVQANEEGFIPQHSLLNAIKQLGAMREQAGLQAKVAGLPVGTQVESKDLTPKVGGLTPGGWKWLGPGNVGGRTLVLVIDPRDPQIMYAGTAGGGIWKTTTGGQSWEVLSEFLGGMAVPTLVMDPTNPDVLYAGTGEGFHNADALRGEGIFESRDGGKTWKQLEGTGKADFEYVNRLAISAAGKVLLAATRGGLFRKETGSAAWPWSTRGIRWTCAFIPKVPPTPLPAAARARRITPAMAARPGRPRKSCPRSRASLTAGSS
jgi:hypothetical protein